MAALSDRMLPHRVAVKRAQRTHDGQGGFRVTGWTTVEAQLACRLTATRLANRTGDNGALRADVTRDLFSRPGSNIRSGDQVWVGTTIWLVQTADDQPDGVYRKAYLLAEQPAG